jgi:hypothetical protein
LAGACCCSILTPLVPVMVIRYVAVYEVIIVARCKESKRNIYKLRLWE